MNSKVSVVKCNDYSLDAVYNSVKEAVGILGGLDKFIRPKSRVLVKPNLLMAVPPETAVVTHPSVARAAIRLLKELDCRVVVGDGPSVWGGNIENIEDVYRISGIEHACREEAVELIDLKKRRWRKKFPLAAVLDECDHVVNLPKVKTHNFTVMSCAIKNLFGLVSGTYKTELHKIYFEQDDFADMLVDIYEEVKPCLSIADGILAMEGDGPGTSGKPKALNLLLASSNAAALDSVVSLIMGMNPQDVPTIRKAASRGLGPADMDNIEILGQDIDSIKDKSFLLPQASFVKGKIPKSVLRLAKSLIKYYPCVERDNCISCAACIRACPNKCISFKREIISFDYKNCISCFCCQEVCPKSAIKTKKSILAKLIGL
ncbi:MAG: DUF362 domain-containing protein [Candidatus Omnitrophota bacterium]|jgi:uncharacterized protein (DUF362 family)/Pyruvate/2-oxoacid:ferredoxin oxidoreductase delta subunit|nr:MAG: DUF362 domain-containing protein [Candidatus Omnitrophota bacterium]